MKEFLLTFIALSRLYPTDCISGGNPANGIPAASGVVLIDNGFNVARPPYCMGALIGSRFVLTHALCCDELFKFVTIHACSQTPFEDGQFFRPFSFRIIGNGDTCRYKLCVIRLDREVEFNKHCISLALPTKTNYADDTNQDLLAFGWGSIFLDPPTDPKQLNILNPIYERVLNSDLMYLEMPLLENRHCEEHYEVSVNASYRLRCHGYPQDRLKRLMLDDHGAPVIGSKDHVLYSIMHTYMSFPNKTTDWKKDSFPIYGIDVYSARNDIILAMRRLLKDKVNPADPVDPEKPVTPGKPEEPVVTETA